MRIPSATSGWCTAVLAGTAVLALLAGGPAHAVKLTFEPRQPNFTSIDQSYGDRVVATPQNGHEYGTEGGFTPNVRVGYGPLPDALPCTWGVGYGDLEDVLFENQDGFGLLEVTFTADAGWLVALHGFDLAAYRAVLPIRSVRVRDGAGEILFERTDLSVPWTGHDTFVFDPPLSGGVLVLAIDSGNLGTHSDDIGVDNILFSQVGDPLPVEPGSWARIKAMYAGGGLGGR